MSAVQCRFPESRRSQKISYFLQTKFFSPSPSHRAEFTRGIARRRKTHEWRQRRQQHQGQQQQPQLWSRQQRRHRGHRRGRKSARRRSERFSAQLRQRPTWKRRPKRSRNRRRYRVWKWTAQSAEVERAEGLFKRNLLKAAHHDEVNLSSSQPFGPAGLSVCH